MEKGVECKVQGVGSRVKDVGSGNRVQGMRDEGFADEARDPPPLPRAPGL